MARRLPPGLDLLAGALRSDGLAEANWQGKSIAIKNALPGETVQSRVVRRRKGHWLLEAYQVEDAHPDRQRPVCDHFPRCGGCTLQHLRPDVQLSLKSERLRQSLQAEGVSDVPTPTIVPGPLTGYRSRARLGVRRLNGGVVVGFRESFSSRVLRMKECQILVPMLASAVNQLTPVINELSIADRIPQLEVVAGDYQAEIVLRHLQPLTVRDKALLEAFQTRSSIRMVLQPGGYETLTYLDGSAYAPNLGYVNRNYGLFFQFGATDFTQVNSEINRQLVQTAMTELNPKPGQRVLDLFCGIGNFSLPVARLGAEVIGLEGSDLAVERANSNARLNGLEGRSSFRVLDLYNSEVPTLPEAEKWLLDPPRSGIGPNLERWLSAVTQKLVYISCNPETFASDSNRLQKLGMKLVKVGIFDMFPHTAHIETLGVFQRSTGSSLGAC